ncbi:hypothetical protein GSN43_004190 [Salmonella enterica]|nr:hypothetical protein [Salmonella enterica]
MLDMRLGNSGDIPFIMNLVRDGITSGAFFYAEGNGLETVRSELQSVTQQYRDNIPVGDYLFVFAEKLGVSLEIGNFCTLSALFNQSWFVRG